MASNVTLKYGDLTEKIPLFGGRLHIPTIKDAFALRGIRVADTLAPFDNEGLTFATFEPGDTLNISGTPAELPAMPGPDLHARIADLERQQQLDGGLAKKLNDTVFRYSESKISKSTNSKLKRRLTKTYGNIGGGKLVCMLTSEVLPSQSVIATHLYKSAWAVFVELALGFTDIDDVRNGLLLWKPIEHAFDTAQMCFTYDSQNDSFVARVVNSALLTKKLSSYGQCIMGQRWAAPSSARAMTLTFADIDNVALSFPSGCAVRPYKHVLCYQAHLAKTQAAKRGWIQLNFDDYWCEDEPYVAKVQYWLSKQTENAYDDTAL